VFVSRRAPAAVLDDLQVDDLSVLRYIDASIDTVAQTVTARVLGVERRAVYRDALGCALELDNLTPPKLPASDRDPGVAPGSNDSETLLPSERSVARDSRVRLDAVVARAFDEPDPRYPRRTRAVVVLQGGRIVVERYRPAPADKARRYGAHFWLEIPPEYAGADPRLPVPALHAAGHEGQFVTIMPSRDLVIVRLGRTRYPQAWDHAAFVRDVLAGLPREPR
jgi:hypothetical protein